MGKQTHNYTITPEMFFDRKQRHRLLKTCKEHSDLDLLNGRRSWVVRYMLVDLALFSGLRVAEMAALKIMDLYLSDKQDSYIIVRNGKGNKKRVVYIDEKLVQHLQDFILHKQRTFGESIEPDAPLIRGREGKHVPINTLQKSFKKALLAANLPDRYSIHSCRHTYATFLLRDTSNLRYVQKQLGHSNIGMTALYADVLPEENGKLANQIKRDELP